MAGTMTRRDHQVGKVYASEQIFRDYLELALDNPQVNIAGSTLVLPPQAKFSTAFTAQAYVNRVLSHPGVVERWGKTTVTVRERKGRSDIVAHYERDKQVIAVADHGEALCEAVILHELAHHFDTSNGPGHGPGFTATMLELVGMVMGVQAELVLRILYGETGVDTK